MSDLDCKKPQPCEPEPIEPPVPCSEPFDLCVGDRTLKWDGFCPTVERTRNTPDGTYTSVTVVDGCIVSYGYAYEPTYTPPYCNPNPTNCQEGTTGIGTSVTIAPNTDNSLTRAAGGLFARTYIQPGANVDITGVGTIGDPYIISSVSTTGGGTVVVARNGLVHETTATGVTYIGMEPTGATPGVYDISDQFTVDRFGRIISSEKRSVPLVTTGTGLESINHGDTVEIKHPTQNVPDVMAFGAYAVAVNNSGHITEAERLISAPAGVYVFGAYDVGVNEFGSITSITERTTSSTSTGGTSTGGSLPLAIRAMHRITMSQDRRDIENVESYGDPIAPTLTLSVLNIPVPAYVTGQDNVTVSGAGGVLNPDTKILTISGFTGGGVVAVTFRA